MYDLHVSKKGYVKYTDKCLQQKVERLYIHFCMFRYTINNSGLELLVSITSVPNFFPCVSIDKEETSVALHVKTLGLIWEPLPERHPLPGESCAGGKWMNNHGRMTPATQCENGMGLNLS